MPGASVSFHSIASIGTGFMESSLERGLDRKPDFIGADAGSVDGGPFALAGEAPSWSRASYYRDLSLLVRGAVKNGIPLLIGSCGMSGRDWGVEYKAEMLRDIVKEHDLHLTMARVYSEMEKELVIVGIDA